MPEKRFFKLVHAQARRNAREAVDRSGARCRSALPGVRRMLNRLSAREREHLAMVKALEMAQ